MDQKIVFMTILGMAVVTVIPRVLPSWLLAKRELSSFIKEWLGYIPIAVLSAMLLPSLLLKDKVVEVGFYNTFLWAAIPTLLVAWKTKNIFLTVALGMGFIAIGRFYGME